MILPSLATAAVDRHLSDAALRVLVLLHGHLDFVRYRPIKAWVIAEALGITRHTAARALHQLVQHGYLDAGARQARRVGTYRLVPTRELTPEPEVVPARGPIAASS